MTRRILMLMVAAVAIGAAFGALTHNPLIGSTTATAAAIGVWAGRRGGLRVARELAIMALLGLGITVSVLLLERAGLLSRAGATFRVAGG